jgi:hypothetical protein
MGTVDKRRISVPGGNQTQTLCSLYWVVITTLTELSWLPVVCSYVSAKIWTGHPPNINLDCCCCSGLLSPRDTHCSWHHAVLLQVAESRHLKALVSMAGPDVICVGAGKAAQEVLKVCGKLQSCICFFMSAETFCTFLFLCSALNVRPLSVTRLWQYQKT